MTTALSQSGQRTPSAQRCCRTSSKHLASSSRPERLTTSDTAMRAQPPQTTGSRLHPIRSETWLRRYPIPSHHPGTQQEPHRIDEALARNGRVVVFGSVLNPYDWNAPWGQLPAHGVRKQQMLAFFQFHYQVKPLDRLAEIKAWEIQPRDKSTAQ